MRAVALALVLAPALAQSGAGTCAEDYDCEHFILLHWIGFERVGFLANGLANGPRAEYSTSYRFVSAEVARLRLVGAIN